MTPYIVSGFIYLFILLSIDFLSKESASESQPGKTQMRPTPIPLSLTLLQTLLGDLGLGRSNHRCCVRADQAAAFLTLLQRRSLG